MKISGARAIAHILKLSGVSNIWGIPGAKTLPIYDEIQNAGIKSVLVTNELSASFMADGYFRVCGKPGVCIAVPGPGLTNMLTGIAEAFLDSSAMLVITVNPRKGRRSFHIHDVPQLDIFIPVVKKIVSISSAGRINELFSAYNLSYSYEPGPVIVEIDSQVFDQEIEDSEIIPETETAKLKIKEKDIAEIVRHIDEAGQVGIYAGNGCRGAGRELLELSKILSAPVATTISGRGVIPEDYELSTGYGFGRTGSPAAYRIFNNCDLILAIGVKFSEMATGGWGLKFHKMIHVDIAKDNLDKNYSSLFSVQADARNVLAELSKSLINRHRPLNVGAIEEIKKYKTDHAAKIHKKKSGNSLHPAILLQDMRKCLPRDAILSTDVGYHQLWSLSDFEVYEPGTYLTPADYQAMGFGIPAAIGAATAAPNKKIVCICGDGGFLISGFELLTAVRAKINLYIFVFNDGALGLIKGLQEKIYNKNVSVDLNNPDLEKFAQSCGVRYFRIDNETNILEKLKAILEHQNVNLVDCRISYNELPQYIKGSLRNSWEQIPLSKKMSILYRYVKCRI